MLSSMSPPLPAEAASVLAALTSDRTPAGRKLNDLAAITGLPTGHIGRHLRTLERDRLARYQGGSWHPTMRGLRQPLADEQPIAA